MSALLYCVHTDHVVYGFIVSLDRADDFSLKEALNPKEYTKSSKLLAPQRFRSTK